MRRYRAMITVFSAVLSEADSAEAEVGQTVAWSVGAGNGRHSLLPVGGVVGSPPLAIVHFGRGAKLVTDGAGAREIARVQGRTLHVTGPILSDGEYAVRSESRMWSLLTSTTRFTVHRDQQLVMSVRETSHQRRTVRSFDIRMASGLDPNVGLALLLLFGGARRQGVLGEVLENR